VVALCNSHGFILTLMYMESAEIRKKFLEFFKARGHVIIPSASLVPENDSTTLFTGSGMQPLVPYLLGQPHPEGKRVANSQKSFRAEDIDEVGDNRHTTFFEMLGNWSFGDYWKQQQLPWFFEFLTKELGIDPRNLYVTVFAGDPETEIPADDESAKIWAELFLAKEIEPKYVQLGSEANGSEKGMQGGRIFSYDVTKNWWSRAGVPSKMPAGEPGGPDSEVFYDFGTPHDPAFGKECHPNCDCGRFLEIGNSVFMEYKKREDGRFEKLAQRNVDFGGGLERMTAAANHDADMFNIDIFENAKNKIAELINVHYYDEGHNGIVVVGEMGNNHGMPSEAIRRAYRVVLDHVRSAVFLIADGVMPNKMDRGYLVRRLLRRAVRFSDQLKMPEGNLSHLGERFIDVYKDIYPGLEENQATISSTIAHEESDFRKVLLREGPRLAEYIQEAVFHGGKLDTTIAFQFATTYGFPIELIIEEAKERGVTISMEEYQKLMKEHQDVSRGGIEQKFKGGLADTSEKTVKLHTAHHLLLKALQIVLGSSVKQRGSNITSERLRLDFSYDGKMTDEQKKEVEKIVNEKIAEDLPVIRTEMPREKAESLNAEHEFGQKYPDNVSVYSIGPKSATQENPQFEKAFSIEFCGGPHMAHTGEIGHFKIAKEEAVAAGIRRVRGVLE
jgi:alanyl-tRNA synthetase